MQLQVHRKAVVISALLTAFLLATAAGGLFLVNRFAAPVEAAVPAQSPVLAIVQPIDPAQLPDASIQQMTGAANSSDALVTAYQTQLQEAYQALQEAYGQIDQLQAAQASPAVTGEQEHEQERGEHGQFFGEREEHADD